MDTMTPEQRRKAMVSNRGRTRPECRLATALWRCGLRYVTHAGYQSIYGLRPVGRPDLIFPRKRVLIFVDGCFWHSCSMCQRTRGLTAAAWISKIDGNIERDKRITMNLQADGWVVIRVPEHAVKTKLALKATVTKIVDFVTGASPMTTLTFDRIEQ